MENETRFTGHVQLRPDNVAYVACHSWATNIHGHNMTAMDSYDIHGYL